MDELTGEEIYKRITPYVKKFYYARRTTIPTFLTEEDYIQEVALAYIKRGKVNIPFACIDVYRKFMPLGRYTYKKYLESNPFPKSVNIDNVDMEKFENIAEIDLTIEVARMFTTLLKNDEKSRYILYEHFFKERTFEEIGTDFGVTAAAISLAQKKVIEYLQYELGEDDSY